MGGSSVTNAIQKAVGSAGDTIEGSSFGRGFNNLMDVPFNGLTGSVDKATGNSYDPPPIPEKNTGDGLQAGIDKKAADDKAAATASAVAAREAITPTAPTPLSAPKSHTVMAPTSASRLLGNDSSDPYKASRKLLGY